MADDIRLVWGNALRYNPPDNTVHQLALEFQRKFEEEYKRVEEVYVVSMQLCWDTHLPLSLVNLITRPSCSCFLAVRSTPCRFIKEVRDKLRTGSTDTTCSLCVGGSELRFEAPNIYCNNPSCGVRIKRNAIYYANENKRFQVRPGYKLVSHCCL